MRLVDRPAGRPHTCAVYPQFGQTHEGKFIDTGTELLGIDPHIYVSVAAVRDMMTLLGWAHPEAHEEAMSELSHARARVEELEGELRKANTYLDSIDVLASRDFLARKKPGRPKKETVNAGAD